MRDKQLIVCPICRKHLPKSRFGICRARKSGRNLYDKSCVRKKVKAQRARQKATREAQQAARPVVQVVRKPNVLAAFDTIKEHVGNGATREELHERTGFDYDELGDLLAVMTFDYQALRIERLPKRKFVVAA